MLRGTKVDRRRRFRPPASGGGLPAGALFALDAHDLGLADGDPVSAWPAIDGVSAVSGGNDPVYEATNANLGSPAVNFHNTNLVLPVSHAGAEATAMVVGDVLGSGAIRLALDSQSPRSYFGLHSVGDVMFANDGSYRRAGTTAVAGAVGMTWLLGGGALDVYLDRIWDGWDTYAYPGMGTQVRMGALYSGSTVFTWQGSIAFLAMWPWVLSEAERIAAWDALVARGHSVLA